MSARERRPTSGMASLAGALADWEELDEVTAAIYVLLRRRRAQRHDSS